MISMLRTRRTVEAINLVALAAAALCCSFPQTVVAQQTNHSGLGLRVERNPVSDSNAAKRLGHIAVDTTSSKAERVSRAALIGAGVGAGTGLIVALVATHSPGVTDHSEDALAYIYIPALGALLGLLVGGVVGFVRN